jgi:hypothetical protein
MAVWQVDFAIGPKRAFATNPRVAVRDLLDTDWWSAERLPPEYARQLAAVAPVGSSSTSERQTWGEEGGNRIEISFENGRATKMIARVDCRRLDAKFGAMLLQFARVANAVLVRQDGLVVEPLVGAFGAALRSSPAWKYVTDPSANRSSHSEPEDDE